MTDKDEDRPEHVRSGKVCDRSIEEWIKAWHRWYLGIPENKHPSLGQYSEERRQDQEQENPTVIGLTGLSSCKDDAWVWFLAGGYGRGVSTRSIIPPGNFYILTPVYVVWASQDEYPSLDTTDKLNDFCEEDVEYVELKANLDGSNVVPYHVKIETPFNVTLPEDNILGLPTQPIEKIRARRTQIVSNGYWLWLKPLSIGDHRLYTYGYSRHYVSELDISIAFAGPRVASKKTKSKALTHRKKL